MKSNYQFTNLCGISYKRGPIGFSPDGNSLLSPVGNRITVFDLQSGGSSTLPFETREDIARFALSPDGTLLLTIDVSGKAVLVNYLRRVVLSAFTFSDKVHCLQFSPNGKYFAVGVGKVVQVWRTPGLMKEFAPFELHRELTAHNDRVTSLEWSDDSKWIMSSSRDMTVKIRSAKVSKYEKAMAKKKASDLDVTVVGPRATQVEDEDEILGVKTSELRDADSDDKALIPFTLSGHKDFVVGAFFAQPNTRVFTVGKDGVLYIWEFEVKDKEDIINDLTKRGIRPKSAGPEEKDKKEEEDDEYEEGFGVPKPKKAKGVQWTKKTKPGDECLNFRLKGGKWVCKAKHFFNQQSGVHTVQLHRASSLLVAGFDNGTFGLYDLSFGFQQLHKLSISSTRITSAAINTTGEWLAFATSLHGQLLVWEWQSEKYVLKQQGHYETMNSLSFSPDGQYIGTGGQDSKVKIWNASTGLAFVTLKDHTGPVTGIVFSAKGQSVFTSSLDGTVRAFDLIRYRNFRTFTSPTPTQFSCVAIDPSGEIVAAGSTTDFSVYIWSVATGRLLDILEGHTAPVVSLQFSPTHPQLASASWDKNVRIWDIYSGSKTAVETLTHSSDLTCLAYRPDGNQLCVASLDGMISFWDPAEGSLVGQIDARKEISAGRAANDARTAKNSTLAKYFTSLVYSADGRCILGCGNSRFVCLYEVEHKILLRKFQISHNRSMDGVVDYLDTRNTHNEELEDYSDSDDDDDMLDRRSIKKMDTLPGVQKGKYSKRTGRLRIRCSGIAFAPSGRQWGVTSTAGLLIYSLDDKLYFDPYMLDVDITPDNILKTLEKEKNYLQALIMAIRLNEQRITKKVFLSIPSGQVKIICQQMHPNYIQRFLTFLSQDLEKSPHLEYHLNWTQGLFAYHGQYLKEHSNDVGSALRNLYKNITRHSTDISALCDENLYLMSYLTSLGSHQKAPPTLLGSQALNEAEDLEESETTQEHTMEVENDDDVAPMFKALVAGKSGAKGKRIVDPEDDLDGNNDFVPLLPSASVERGESASYRQSKKKKQNKPKGNQ